MRFFGKLSLRVFQSRTPLERAILLSLALSLLFISLLPSKYPTYRGRTLQSWLREYQKNESFESEKALSEIGPRALPFILECFETNMPGPYLPALITSPFAIQGYPINAYLREQRLAMRWNDAEPLLRVLGQKAHATMPVLQQRLKDPQLYYQALAALRLIEPDNARALEITLKKGNTGARCELLGRLRENPCTGQTLDVIKAATSHPDWQVRRAAYSTLFEQNLDTETRQKFLLQSLQERTVAIPNSSLSYLSRNPSEVWLVLPQVRELTNSVFCRTQAFVALRAARLIPKGVVREALIPAPDVKRKLAQR
jgi:hypothetical protein